MADKIEIDQTEVRTAFEDANIVLAGRPAGVVIAALIDLAAASICFCSDDIGDAIANAEAFRADVENRIRTHFDHYHRAALSDASRKRRH